MSEKLIIRMRVLSIDCPCLRWNAIRSCLFSTRVSGENNFGIYRGGMGFDMR